MRTPARTSTLRKSKDVYLVEGVQPLCRRPLDEVVFPRRFAEGALAALGFGKVNPLERQGVVGSPLEAVVPVLEGRLQVFSVGSPPLTLHPRCRFPVEAIVGLTEAVPVTDGVPKRGPPPRGVPLRCLS